MQHLWTARIPELQFRWPMCAPDSYWVRACRIETHLIASSHNLASASFFSLARNYNDNSLRDMPENGDRIFATHGFLALIIRVTRHWFLQAMQSQSRINSKASRNVLSSSAVASRCKFVHLWINVENCTRAKLRCRLTRLLKYYCLEISPVSNYISSIYWMKNSKLE